MASPIADIVIDPDLPGGGTVVAVLGLVQELCHRAQEINGPPLSQSSLALFSQLQVVFAELQRNERGALNRDVTYTFVTTLDEYWRHLTAYKNMTIIERLLNHRKMKKTIADLHENVNNLYQQIGLATAHAMGNDWRKHYEIGAADQQRALEAFATNSVEVLEELRGRHEQQQALVLLKAELDKMQNMKSELPAETQEAIKRAFMTIVRASYGRVEPTPVWFIPEADVTFRERPIGQGAFASVHSGTYGEHTRVVVKLLLPGEGSLDAAMQHSFCQEIEQWYKFRHPHVVQLLGANHASSRPFIVMAEAPNRSVVEYFERSLLNLGQRWRLLYQAALGVEFLHRSGGVHADLKLSNILVSATGAALVTDFGLSRIKARAKGKSRTMRKDGKLVMGSLRWMAPEQFTHKPQLASDVYSFAMTILEAFLGEPPYAYLDDESARERIMSGVLPPRPDGMFDDAWQLINAMTVRDPRERVTMADAVAHLKRFADEEEAVEQGRESECGVCGMHLSHEWETCPQCGGSSVGQSGQVLIIESEETLRQMVSFLTRGTAMQRERALAALSEYACGDERHQEAVLSAGAVPLILKLLEDGSKNVRLGAILALSAIASTNPAGQDAIAQDRGFEYFLRAISNGSDGLVEQGLLALCVTIDNNANCQAAARTARAIPLLLDLSSRCHGRSKLGADMALKLLQSHDVTLDKVTSDEALASNATTSIAVKIHFSPATNTTEEGAEEPAVERIYADAELLELRVTVTGTVDAGTGEDSLLWWAVTNRDIGLVLYLARNGADVNITDKVGRPLLHAAMQLRSLKMLQCLIQNGAAIDSRNEAGETVLHIAAATRFVRAVSFLTSAKADPNAVDTGGRSALQRCLFPTQLDSSLGLEAAYAIVFTLCEHGAAWDSCERLWQAARARANADGEASTLAASWQVGMGACAQHWIQQRKDHPQRKLLNVPMEVVQRGEASVATYITESSKTNADGGVYRRKICVVGHTTFGKTSFVNSVVKNKSSCATIQDRTVGIDRTLMTFKEVASETTNQHDVTFWDYAGQSIYQSAHSVFFSKRTMYVLCVDLRVYETMLYSELASDDDVALPFDQHVHRMRRFLSEHVFRWVRLVLMRQPDALFLVVGTKRDELKRETSEKEIHDDFKRRLASWVKSFLHDAETGSVTTAACDHETRALLRESLNRIQQDQWITVNNLSDTDVQRARQLIEQTIVDTAEKRSFKMPDEYVRVLERIQAIQTDATDKRGERRITSATIGSDALVLELTKTIRSLDHETCCTILRTLCDLGDILWFESDGPETLRDYVIVDPVVVIDVVRGAVNHKRAEDTANATNPALREHGMLKHNELVEAPLWCDMNDELLRAFKELLQFFELAYPAGTTMDWDSHLIIPAYRKGNTDFTSESLLDCPSTLCLGGVPLDHVVGWKYELSDEISDTVFDQLCVKSYNGQLKIRAGPDAIEADYDIDGGHRFKLRIAIERGSYQNDTISLEVAATDRDTCWYFMKWFVLKAQSVLKGYPALKPRCRVFDPEAGTPKQGLRIEEACALSDEADPFHPPTELPDLCWANLDTQESIAGELREMKRELAANLQLLACQVNKIDALMKLVVTTSDRELPALWVFKYNEDNPSVAEVSLLSNVSGKCFHEPLRIEIPPAFLSKHGWLIQNAVNLLGNVADCFIGDDILKTAMGVAKSALDEQVTRAQAVHTLIQAMDSPDASGFSSTDRPVQSTELLRKLLQLADANFDERYINTKSNLYCAAVKDTGTYLWASRDEIKDLGDKVIPCGTYVFETPPPSPTASTTSSASAVSGTSAGLSKPHALLVVETVGGFTSWDWRKTYCTWSLLAPKTPEPLAKSQTPCHVAKGTAPVWTKRFAIECVTSLPRLREYELRLTVQRPSRIPFSPDKVLAHVVLKLKDHVPADSTRATPVRIESFPLVHETQTNLSISLSITVPDAPAASSA